ncbi:apolipoprotein D [Musca domestica]|uniref:Apolipoprotein D n=1 Tax=Musca domestica TaxID=7370 RepID=T1PL53_MUSDO|nr:apolipoprotein D [Musca domestica]
MYGDKMKSLKQIAVLICLIQLGQAQVLNRGSCNKNIPTVQNFDATRYLGRWYEQEKYPFIFELGGKCIYAEYGQLKNGDLSVYNYNINELTGRPNDILGSAKLVDSGKLKVRFNNMPAFIGSADYWVLDTDYDNYAVVYSCTDVLGLFNAQVVWILTRERSPNPQYIEKARSVIKQNGLSLKPLQRTNQQGC